MNLRNCEKHGVTKFNEYKEGSYQRWRCGKCQTDAVNKRRRKLKVMAVDYKGGECSSCGYSRSIAAMEFHHRDPNEKDFAISVSGATRSFESIKIELDKCDLLCANCHREVHAEYDGNFIGVDVTTLFKCVFDEINT